MLKELSTVLLLRNFIECPGQTGCLTVYITTAANNNPYNIILQKADVMVQMQAISTIGPGNMTSHQFCNLSQGIYQILLVDPALTQFPSVFNYDPINDPQVYSASTAVLISPLQLNVQVSSDGLDCWDDVSALISVNLSNYTQPYTVTLKDVNNSIIEGPTTLGVNDTSYTFSTLVPSGDYTICATDMFTCPEVCTPLTIASPDTLVPSGSIDQEISCYAASDGEISVSAVGGTTFAPPLDPYTYSWTGPSGFTANTDAISGLGPGVYTCVIADSLLCDTLITFTLVEPDSLAATSTPTHPVCFDGTGYFNIFIDSIYQGSGGPFDFSLNGGTGQFGWTSFASQTTLQTTPLPAGTYSNMKVRDASGCEVFLLPDTLIQPDLLQFSYNIKTYLGTPGYNVSCNGACDAEIIIDSVWGGNLPPYGNSASFFGGVAFIDTLISSDSCASATPYNHTVTDAEGCIGTNSVTITEPPVFSISAVVSSAISCPGDCDGEVTITPSFGQGSINYSVLNNNAYTWTASNTSPNTVTALDICGVNTNGQDTIIALDTNGCFATTFVNLSEPPLFNWDQPLGVTDENCALANGAAWIKNLTGGDGNFSYAWTSNAASNLQPVDSIFGLSFGEYVVTFTDGQGCSDSDTTYVDSSYILIEPITVNVPCNAADNGVITINTNGVLLSEVTLILIDTISFPPTSSVVESYVSSYSNGFLVQDPNIDTVMSFNDLQSTIGNEVYELRVELFGNTQGSAGCDPKSYYIEIGDSVSIEANLDSLLSNLNLLCFGDSTNQVHIKVHDTFVDTLGDPYPNSPSNNSFNADISGGLFNTFITEQAPFNVLFNSTPAPGLLSSIFSDIYTVIITPELDVFSNCVDTVQFEVTEPDSLQFTLGSTPALCNGSSDGSVYVDTIFGGTTGYNYVWKDFSGATVSFLDSVVGLQAGLYILTVTDANLCPVTIDTIEIFEPTPVSYIVDTLAIDICSYTNATGQFLLSGLGGVGQDIPANYTYNWWNFDSTYATTLANPNGLVSDWYKFIVTDANGCVTEVDSAFIPNGVDPILDQSFVNTISCFGADDGSYIAVVDSTNPLGSDASPFAFWNPATLSYDPSYIPQETSLGPDTIVIQIVDAIGCQAFDTVFITEPLLLEIIYLDTLTYIGGYNVSCNSSLDGELTIHAAGGTKDYIFWIQDSTAVNPSSSDSVFSGLASTYYKTFVEDHNGCLDSLDIFLSQPDSLLVDSFNLSAYVGGWNISCLGEDDGNASVFVSGGNLGYSYTWSNGDTTNIADTLSAGSYTVIVTDTNGCIDSASIVLIEPTSSLVIDSIVPTHLDCKEGDNGNATVFVSGATPGYTYLWDNANSTIPTYFNPNDTVASLNDVSAFADTLRAGTYNVDVWDANGCYLTGSITITEPSISINIDSLAVTQMTCYTYNDASVLMFTTGPQSTPNLYTLYNEADPLDTIKPLTISPGTQGNIGFSGLGPLTHVVYVQDDLGCIDRDTFTIDPLDQVYIDTIIYTNISCNGYNDGYIDSIVPMGGTPPYEYNIDGDPQKYPSWACTVDPNTCPLGLVFTGLNPGVHTIGIFDANGCVSSYNITISEPPAMVINYSTNNYNNYEIACAGDTDEVTFNIVGAVAPYDIMLGNDTETTNATFTWTGLYQGVYNFDIEAANGCQESVSVTLSQPDSINVNPFVTDIFCADSCSGDITVVVSGGAGQGIGTNYSYQWLFDDPALGWIAQSGEISYYIDSLCEGNYAVEITDNNNCVDSFLVPIGQNALNIITANSTITDVGCYGDCNGSITVFTTGGVPSSNGDYTYLWDDPLNQTTKTAIGLCAGTYNCIVTDMAGCVVTQSFDVVEPDKFVATITSQEVIDCYGGKGKLRVTTSGGTSPLINSRLWSSGGSNQIESNLIAGTYSCFVTDANGCTDTAFYTLSEPDQLEILSTDIDVTNVGCKGDATGEILITATGGTPVPGIPGYYTYDLSGPSTSPSIQMATANFTALLPGIYTVTVTDKNGCTVTSNDIFVDEPENPLTVTIDAQDETCAAAACAIIYPIGGTKSYTYEWDNDGVVKPYVQGNCDQLKAEDNTPHTVNVTDANGCEATASITLLGYLNIFLPDNASTFSEEYCYGEEVEINIQTLPNLSYVWSMDNRWTTEVGDDTIISTTADLTIVTDSFWGILNTEILTLTITDDNECSKSVEATIDLNYLDLNCEVSGAGEDRLIVEGTLITFSENSGYATYEWTNSNDELLSDNSQFSISPTQSDMYTLYTTDGDCMGYCSIYVALGVIPVDVISPNGDGVNEDWYIRDLEKYDNSIVQLFNRWGDMLFEYKEEGNRITNDFYDWTDLNIGTYNYIIDLGDGSLPQTGPLTIIK